MAKYYLVVDGIAQDRLLETLLTFVQQHDDPRQQAALHDVHLAVENVTGLNAKVAVPLGGRGRLRRANQYLRDQMLSLQNNQQPAQLRADQVKDSPNYQPVLTLLPNFIERTSHRYARQGENQWEIEEQHGAVHEELLLIFPPHASGGNLDWLDVFNQLRRYPTQVRAAQAFNPQGERYSLFHVLDDTSRRSLLQGLFAGGYFSDAVTARAYRVELNNRNYKFFVHRGVLPDQTRLALLIQFMQASQTLFTRQRAPEQQHELIAAAHYPGLSMGSMGSNGVEQAQSRRMGQLLYLATVPFFEESMIGTQQGFVYYPVVPLSSRDRDEPLRKGDTLENQALARLRAQIPRGTAGGYRLQLRYTQYRELEDSDRARADDYERRYNEMQRKLLDLQDRLAQIDSLRVPRPLLLRFTQARLPLLIQTLSDYRHSDLSNILYMDFQPNHERSDHPDMENVHYVYIPPTVHRQLAQTVIQNDHLEDNPMSFWLDPHWAGRYSEHTSVELFVPRGRLLSPPLHSWEPADMSRYLRNMLADLLSDEVTQPLYVLWDVQRPGYERTRDIAVSVLDKAAFRPINQPGVIRWLNDNLIFLRRARAFKQDVSDLASDVRRQTFAQASLDRSQATYQRFEAEAHRVLDAMQGATDGLLQQLDVEYNANLEKAQALIKRAVELNQRLAAMEALYGQTDGRRDETQKQIDETRQQTKSTRGRTDDLRAQVEQAIKEAQATMDDAKKKVREKIEDLRKTNQRLRDDIDELRGLL